MSVSNCPVVSFCQNLTVMGANVSDGRWSSPADGQPDAKGGLSYFLLQSGQAGIGPFRTQNSLPALHPLPPS